MVSNRVGQLKVHRILVVSDGRNDAHVRRPDVKMIPRVRQTLVLPHRLLTGNAFDVVVKLPAHALDRHRTHLWSHGSEHLVQYLHSARRVGRWDETCLPGIRVKTVLDALEGQVAYAACPGGIGGELTARVDFVVEPEYLGFRLG